MDTDDLGKLVLRLTVGGLLLFHGVHKVLTGIGDISELLGSHHLPEFLAYGVYAGEVLGPLLILFGLFARAGGLLVVINMIFAVGLAGMNALFTLNALGGYALELEAFYLFGAVAIMLLGAGRISIGGEDGTLN
jgi:putative oxidoreductase